MSRPQSAGSVRLEPIRRMTTVRDGRGFDTDRILEHAHIKGDASLRLVELGCERRAFIAASVLARKNVSAVDGSNHGTDDDRPAQCDAYRQHIRDAIETLVAVMRAHLQRKSAPPKGSVLEWLVNLPASLQSNDACRDSIKLTDNDVDWLVRKGAATLSLLLGTEEDQRAHAIRRHVAAEEINGYLERVGRLRGDAHYTDQSDWVGALLKGGISSYDAAEYLLALFIYTTNCSSRASVDGWERSADDEWTMIAKPARSDVHGFNASPWAVLNWTLRVAYDASQSDQVRTLAASSLAPFAFLRDRIDEALLLLPKTRSAVFRGVNIPGLSYRYALSFPVIFPPFTSTSTVGTEAVNYMRGEGTFFVLRAHSAARIDFVSFVPAEAEKLLPSFSRFGVVQKASNTVLRMLECPYDIVSMAEHGDDSCTDADAVAACVRSMHQTRFIHEAYLRDTYIEGSVGPLPPPCDTSTPLFAALSEWINGSGHVALVGTGGSGKTSATLAANCFFAAMDGYVPVFVPVSTVPGLLWEDGALDRHVGILLNLSAAQMDLMALTRTVVVLLESLDEVPLHHHDDTTLVDMRTYVLGLLQKNPFCAKARVLLSCRDEFLSRHDMSPFDLFGSNGKVLHVQPFSDADVTAFVAKHCAKTKLSPAAAASKENAIRTLSRGLRDALSNPCVLHMACRTNDAAIRTLVESAVGRIPPSDVYEAYLQQELCSGGSKDNGDACMRAVQNVALSMLSKGDWTSTVGDVAAHFGALGVATDEFKRLFLPQIPRRVENDADDAGAFAFWHKSMGEYLAARAFWTAPDASLASVQRAFSLDVPAVLTFFGDISMASLAQRDEIAKDVFIPAVVHTRDSNADSIALTKASNALSLTCASGYFLHTHDLSGIRIEDGNFDGAWMQGARVPRATFKGCNFSRASLDCADISDAMFPSSHCELAYAPLRGHAGAVQCVCYSPTGIIIASGSKDNTVRTWDGTSGTELACFVGHTGAISGLCFSPDGTTIVTGSSDTTVRMWDVPTGTQSKELSGHTRPVYAVCYSPDGTLIASGAFDASVIVWSASSGLPFRTFDAYDDCVSAVCFSPSGAHIATGSWDGSLSLISLDSMKVRIMEGHSERVSCVSFSPDGKNIASGSLDCSVRIWNASTGREVKCISEGINRVTCAAYSPDGSVLVSGSLDGNVCLWNAISGKLVVALEGHKLGVAAVAFSPNGACIATGSYDSTVRIWNSRTVREVRALDGPTESVMAARYSPDGRLIVSGCADGSVSLWDASSGRLVCATTGHERLVASVCFSPDGTLIASSSDDATVSVWEVSTGRRVHLLEGHTMIIVCVSFSPDGALLASVSHDGACRLWNTETGVEVRTLVGEEGEELASLCFSPDGATLVVGDLSGTIHFWEVCDGHETKFLDEHQMGVVFVCFAPDGRMLASASLDWCACIWDVVTGTPLHWLQGHKYGVFGVSFSPDAIHLATASYDGTVCVWDTSTGSLASPPIMHGDAVLGVSFSPDGSTLLTASKDKSLRVWDAPARVSAHASAPDITHHASTSNAQADAVRDVNTPPTSSAKTSISAATTTTLPPSSAETTVASDSSTSGAQGSIALAVVGADTSQRPYPLKLLIGRSSNITCRECVGVPAKCDNMSSGLYSALYSASEVPVIIRPPPSCADWG
eukprot:Opistho-2@10952